jgi:hypothetical protein
VVVKDVEIMNFPHEEFFGQMVLDKVEQTAPGLVPLVEGELKFTVIV